MIFDWDAWWALEMSDGPCRHVKYLQTLVDWYAALHRRNVAVDVVGADADLSRYRMICAPVLFMVPTGFADRVSTAVDAGTSFVTGVLSGRVDDDDLAHLSDLPGPFAELCGVRVDETDSLPPDRRNAVITGDGRSFGCSLVHDLVQPTDADVIGVYAEDFYAGTAAVTHRRAGNGHAWYAGTLLDADGLDWIIAEITATAGVDPVLAGVGYPIEVTERHRDDTSYLFILNHASAYATVTVNRAGTSLLDRHPVVAGQTMQLEPHGVMIIMSPRPAGRQSPDQS